MSKDSGIHNFDGTTRHVALNFPQYVPEDMRKPLEDIQQQFNARLQEINKRLNYLESKIVNGADSTVELGTDTTTLTFEQGILTDNS